MLKVYNLHLFIGTAYSTSTWTYAELSAGIDNVAEALNEVVQQYQFLAGQGFAENDVTGMAPAVTLSGRRVHGDAAQDYIFGKKYELGSDRKSSLKITWSDGTTNKQAVVGCTLCNIQEWSGATTDNSAISVEIRYDEKPTVTTVQ